MPQNFDLNEEIFDLFLRLHEHPNLDVDINSMEYKFVTFIPKYLKNSKAQLLQDLWVLFELHEKLGGYFVEIGATDGMLLSNTYLLEKHFGWKGALSEPNPVWHNALYKNRSAFISARCISGRSNEVVPFNLTQLPEYSTIEKYSNLDIRADLRDGGTIIPIETLSLNDFLAAAESPRSIDFLSIDTEGSEYDILSTFDFSSYDIRLISVEHNYSDNRTKLFDLLNKHGFARKFDKFSKWDDWYVKVSW